MGTSPKTGEELERKKLSLYFRGTSEAEGVNTPRSDESISMQVRGWIPIIRPRFSCVSRNFEF